MKTYDCQPTLTDSQVLEFCHRGYLLLPAVVDPEVDALTLKFRETHRETEVHEILKEPWFEEGVLCNPQAAGAVRSLLGRDFYLPHLMFSHRSEAPFTAQGWHRDGFAKHSLQLNYLQLFYYPQAAPPELGPTEFLPGSHFLYAPARHMGHYDRIKGAFQSSAPAGSILLTAYTIWHRRPSASGQGTRDLLKYNCMRSSAPCRDWIRETGFDPKTADYSTPFWPTFREQFRECADAAEMFAWLCGRGEQFKLMGGHGWPVPATYPSDDRYAYPLEQLTHPEVSAPHQRNGKYAVAES